MAFPWLAAAVISSSILGAKSASDASKSSASQAQSQMDWEERMYKTRHQMEVEDLKKAGLNPVLSAHSAGSVPGGAMGSVYPEGQGATEAASALADLRLKNSLQKTEATKQEVNKSQADLNKENQMVARVMKDIYRGEREVAATNALKAQVLNDFYGSWTGRQLLKLDAAANSLRGVASTARDVAIAGFTRGKFGNILKH